MHFGGGEAQSRQGLPDRNHEVLVSRLQNAEAAHFGSAFPTNDKLCENLPFDARLTQARWIFRRGVTSFRKCRFLNLEFEIRRRRREAQERDAQRRSPIGIVDDESERY